MKKSFVLSDIALRRLSKNKLDFLLKIKDVVYDIRIFGCAVFNTAQIAKGTGDAYLVIKTNSWDIAAGFLIIEEANGKVTDFSGNRWKPENGSYIASNGFLHDKIVKALK